MKQLFMAIALALMPMGVSGCATIASLTGQEEVARYDEQALLVAERAFDTASAAILAAEQSGALTPELSADIRPKYREAYDALLVARTLYDANMRVEAEGVTRGALAATAALLKALVDAGIME